MDTAINKDIKMEKEEQAALKRQITATESKKEQLLDLLLNKSITQDLYNKKYTSLCNEQEKMKHRLESYDLIVRKSLVTCKTLFLLANRAYELFESSKTEEKRRLIKILFSKLAIDGKNCLFSKRKAVETLLSTAFHQKWLGTTCKTRAKIKGLAQIFDFLTSMAIGFSGSPERVGTTCKTRAKTKS